MNLREMLTQVLENQCAILLVDMKSYEDEKMRHHLGKMRKHTVEILEKERKTKQKVPA